jgi:hypothetical protein
MKQLKAAGVPIRMVPICAAAVVFSIAGLNSHAQEPSQKPTPPPPASQSTATVPSPKLEATTQDPSTTNPSVPANPRQAQILADTRKLLKLSQELQAEVARSSKDTLSLTVIKKAEEVEKLARTLREEIGRNH